MASKTRKFTVVIPVASGTGTGYTPFVSGYVESIQVTGDYTAGAVDFTITAEATGETIWTASNLTLPLTKRPRAPTHSTAGVAAVYAADGEAVNDRIALARDRVKIAIAQGGTNKTGTFVITIADR